MSGNRWIPLALVALAALAAMFFVGRAGGSKERTTHVRGKQESHSVVVVKEKTPRISTISAGVLADLVSPPQQQSSPPGTQTNSNPTPVIIGGG
jgi:hypothetical protein